MILRIAEQGRRPSEGDEGCHSGHDQRNNGYRLYIAQVIATTFAGAFPDQAARNRPGPKAQAALPRLLPRDITRRHLAPDRRVNSLYIERRRLYILALPSPEVVQHRHPGLLRRPLQARSLRFDLTHPILRHRLAKQRCPGACSGAFEQSILMPDFPHFLYPGMGCERARVAAHPLAHARGHPPDSSRSKHRGIEPIANEGGGRFASHVSPGSRA